ncbi:ATP-binding cassette domain-containing protein [Egibacter rhizosphaerae]|uniref:ATP-binding cassette domain-containing protein n=1 Tax=Egibacter rhizosphaerae TaxID=1670831 RepID=A0A411YF74_9ACTN|nr:ATP-binding cassette domain-containing protein [Egibacter rhizosphaerae]QBI19878.1 ATP-binding cassette domain-containing protein [Egibacter rhizosphaerae]
MIHTDGLTKWFKVTRGEYVHAVRAIDLSVGEGELAAVLGPNGAGKSTTLRMLTTLLEPSEGRATVAGHDVRSARAAVRQRIGYIGQGNGAGHYQRVRDELVVQGYAYGLRRREAHRRADELLDTLQLTELAKRTVATLSGGQRRRLDIALGLMHAPPVLFLDEPSTGLDPQNRANLWEHVLAVREQFGTTLLLTTHYLDEADAMAERVVIIDHGRIIADDTSERLKAGLAGDRVSVVAADPEDAARVAELAVTAGEVHEASTDGPVVTVRAPEGRALLPAWLRTLDAEGLKVSSADVARPTLDDVFLSLTGRSLREEAGDLPVATPEQVAA